MSAEEERQNIFIDYQRSRNNEKRNHRLETDDAILKPWPEKADDD